MSNPQRVGRILMAEKRVQFDDAVLALHMAWALLDTKYAMQLTTYPDPRVTGKGGVPGPRATIDFVEYTWVVDAVELMRDVHGVQTSRDGWGDTTTSEPHAIRVWRETIAKYANQPAFHVGLMREWLGYVVHHEAVWRTDALDTDRVVLDSLWRIGGKSALVGVFVQAYNDLGDWLWQANER